MIVFLIYQDVFEHFSLQQLADLGQTLQQGESPCLTSFEQVARLPWCATKPKRMPGTLSWNSFHCVVTRYLLYARHDDRKNGDMHRRKKKKIEEKPFFIIMFYYYYLMLCCVGLPSWRVERSTTNRVGIRVIELSMTNTKWTRFYALFVVEVACIL